MLNPCDQGLRESAERQASTLYFQPSIIIRSLEEWSSCG